MDTAVNPYDDIIPAPGPPPTGQASTNPYDDILPDTAARQRQLKAATLHLTIDGNPDTIAAQRRLAQYLGYPTPVVTALPAETQREAQIKTIDQNTANAPVLAQRYTDADFAAIAHDDSGVLSTLENSFRRGWPGLKQNLSATALGSNASTLQQIDNTQALLDSGRRGLTLTQDPHGIESMTPEQRATYRAQLIAAAGGNASTIATSQAEKGKFPSPQVVNDVMQAKSFGEAVKAFMSDPIKFIAAIGPESLVQNGPGMLAAAVMPGGAIAKAATMGASSFATDYGSTLLDAIGKEGVDIGNPAALAAAAQNPALMRRAAAQAMAHAGVVGPVDGLSGGIASKLALPGKFLSKAPVARELANRVTQTPIQGAMGGIGEAGGELAAGQPLDPGNILAEVVGEAFSAPAEVASIAAGNVRERMAQASEAKAHAASIEQLVQSAGASKLRQRDPDALAAFLKDASDDAEVFVNAASFAQSMPPEKLASLPAAIREQMPEALQTGGDISISVGDLAAHLGDVPGLVQHLRASPESMTAAEAEAYKPDEHLRAEVERLAPAEAAPEAPTPQADALARARQTVIDALSKANRFTPQVNAQYADLISSFISTTAERAGLDVGAIQAMVPRIVSRLDPLGGTLDQSQTPVTDAGTSTLNHAEDTRRGAFEPTTKTIALLEHADLSTFLHESGHYFLDGVVSQATRADAPAGIKGDVQTLLDWFGVPDVAAWNAMTLDQQRDSHEKFARGFERYLMEGKAPSVELQSMFSRFRSWLLSVYKKASALNVDLTPEVRGVMDRLLATDSQIAEATARRSLRPLFESAAAAGMTPEEFQRYQAQGQQATEAAVGELQGKSLRDMQFIANSKRRAISKLNAEARAKRAGIEAEVTTEVYATQVYAAWRDLSRGHTENGQPIRLSRHDVEQSHPEIVDKLPPAVLANSERALPADMVAEAYGLSSGDEMVKLLATLDKPAQVIEGETDRRMLERHGELADERAIEQAAHAAIANDARAQVLATESNALAKAVGNKPLLTAAAREFASSAVAARKVRELRPAQFEAAEARAGREADAAFKKADLPAAAAAKRTQLLQHVLARATRAAVAEVDRAVNYLSKFDSAATRKAIGPEYADQIDQLLERVDLRSGQSLKAIDKRKSLAAWVAAQEEIGFSPVIDPRLLNEAQRTSYKDMTVEELRGLVDTVKNIEHLGRLKERLLTARDDRAFADVVGAVASGIVQHGGKVRPVELEGEKGVRPWLQGVAASHRKINSLANQMDGGIDNGPVFDALVRPMNDAGTHEQVLIEQATEKLAELYAPIHELKGGTTGAKVFISEIGASLTRGGRLSVALNWGNGGNRQRLMDGDHWTAEQVQAIVRTLSPVELQFVNQVHEYIDSFWPEVKAQQLRVSGVVEDKVPATPWTATASDGTQVEMRGGYYPAKYDTARSAKAESHDAAQVAKDMLQGAYVRATTRRGFTKARSDEVKDRPLRKDLGVITQHVTEVTHNLAWQEWLIDANRLLGAKAIDGAIRAHYGPAVIRTMKDNLQGIATADVVPGTAIDRALMALRGNVTRATLGASFTTAFMQPFGLSNSMARIGAVPVLRGLARWGGDAARFESSMSWVAEKSDAMRLRAKTMNREINEISGRVAGKSQTMQVIDTGLMYLTAKAQQFVDIPTWIGRYEQAIAQGHDEGTAVALADEAVLASQGGGQTKDLAEVQRKHPMLTQFYSYFSTTLNLVASKTATTDFKNPKAVAGWLGDMALLTVIPALGPAVLTELLRGGGAGDDEKKWLRKLAEWQASYLMSMVVGVRELSGVVGGFSYAGPPVGRIVTDVTKVAQQANQGEVDEPAVVATARLIGDLTGIPTVQLIRSYKGWEAWSHGDAPVTAVLMGPPPKD